MNRRPHHGWTPKMRILFGVRGAVYMMLLTCLFYVPTLFLIPDEIWPARWATWALGWVGALAMEEFRQWYFKT